MPGIFNCMVFIGLMFSSAPLFEYPVVSVIYSKSNIIKMTDEKIETRKRWANFFLKYKYKLYFKLYLYGRNYKEHCKQHQVNLIKIKFSCKRWGQIYIISTLEITIKLIKTSRQNTISILF